MDSTKLTASKKGFFGSKEITKLIRESSAKLVFVGHMYFAYETRVGQSRVIGLGYGVMRCYATLDKDLNVSFKKFREKNLVRDFLLQFLFLD